jgi:hypothetical protein
MHLEGKYVYLMLLSYLMLKLTMEKLMFDCVAELSETSM